MRINLWAGSKLNDILAALALGWRDHNSREYFGARAEVLKNTPVCL